jgi:hypothetical protein
MTSLPAKVIAIEKRGNQYQVIVQISTTAVLLSMAGSI